MYIYIENFSPKDKSGFVLAVFDIAIQDPDSAISRINNCKILRSKNGEINLQLPSYTKENPDGRKVWLPFFCLKPEKYTELKSEVFHVLKAQGCI